MTVHLKNPSCGDDLTVQLKVSEDRVLEIRQSGEGCSICCASASMMAELLESETLTSADSIIEQFTHMVQAEPFDEEAIGEAVSLQGVSHLPQRVKCATLGWQATSRGLAAIRANRLAGTSDDGEIVADVEKEEQNEA